MTAGLITACAGADLEVEKLGVPVQIRELGIHVVTRKASGGHIAWGWRKQEGLVGVDVATGKTFELDMRKFRAVNVALARGPEGDLFFYVGTPGRFFKYTPQGELVELGTPDKTPAYWIGGHQSKNDILYVGTYPEATLVACDLKTGESRSYGRLTKDMREKYIIRVAAADDGTVYSGVGLHHQELWALNPKTGEKRQILPEPMTSIQGSPRLWTGKDGHVYGKTGKTTYRCTPTSIEECKPVAERRDPTLKMAGNRKINSVDDQGRLQFAPSGSAGPSYVQTDYRGREPRVYCLGGERGGKLYGGTLFPGRPFTVDLKSGELTEMRGAVPQVIQIYDIMNHPNGLFFASYMGCILDFLNPEAPRENKVNPIRFKTRIPGHERPNQWELGPDGKLYFGTVPAKGRLGGALVQVDPDTRKVKVWDKIMPDLSIPYLASVSGAGLIFGCTSVGGGSSAIPTKEEAETFLWDTGAEKVVWTGKPVPGTRSYGRAISAANGMIVGLAEQSWYLFDPETKETVHRGRLPVKRLRFPQLSDGLVGPKGWVVGIGDDKVFAIDAQTRELRILGEHKTLNGVHGFHVTADGTLFYGSHETVYRCHLPLD
ncbi:MAG: hypothetical protein KAI66_02035 [Lentisphaeria bacterium]|nr:hypothetical protein [Lentisphaeria bacterium]